MGKVTLASQGGSSAWRGTMKSIMCQEGTWHKCGSIGPWQLRDTVGKKGSRSGQGINHTHVHPKSFEVGPGNHGVSHCNTFSRKCSDQPCFQNDLSHSVWEINRGGEFKV